MTIPVALFYVAIAAWSGRSEITVFSAALTGGLCGFLIYKGVTRGSGS